MLKLEAGQVWYRIWDKNDIDVAEIIKVEGDFVEFKVTYLGHGGDFPPKIREWYVKNFISEFDIPPSSLLLELL